MFKPCAIVYLEDPALQNDVQKIADSKNINVSFAGRGDQLAQLVKNNKAFLLIVDLSGLDSAWLFKHLSAIKYTNPEFPIYGILGAEDEAQRSRAEKYGCKQCLLLAEWLSQLPDIIETHLRKSM